MRADHFLRAIARLSFRWPKVSVIGKATRTGGTGMYSNCWLPPGRDPCDPKIGQHRFKSDICCLTSIEHRLLDSAWQ